MMNVIRALLILATMVAQAWLIAFGSLMQGLFGVALMPVLILLLVWHAVETS